MRKTTETSVSLTYVWADIRNRDVSNTEREFLQFGTNISFVRFVSKGVLKLRGHVTHVTERRNESV